MFDNWHAHKVEEAAAHAETLSRLQQEKDELQILIVVEGQGGTLGTPAS